jgi:hypothetical protein
VRQSMHPPLRANQDAQPTFPALMDCVATDVVIQKSRIVLKNMKNLSDLRRFVQSVHRLEIQHQLNPCEDDELRPDVRQGG